MSRALFAAASTVALCLCAACSSTTADLSATMSPGLHIDRKATFSVPIPSGAASADVAMIADFVQELRAQDLRVVPAESESAADYVLEITFNADSQAPSGASPAIQAQTIPTRSANGIPISRATVYTTSFTAPQPAPASSRRLEAVLYPAAELRRGRRVELWRGEVDAVDRSLARDYPCMIRELLAHLGSDYRARPRYRPDCRDRAGN